MLIARIVCNVFGHDWMLIFNKRLCLCNPDCKAEVTTIKETRCRRCWELGEFDD